jgi:hypothetical protein
MMQPFLWFLLLEAGVFMLGVLGDVYLTNALVKSYGTKIEANPRVRKMYEEGKLWKSWGAVIVCLLMYVALSQIGFQAIPYAPSIAAVGGAGMALAPSVNLVRGSVVFAQLRRRP